MRDTVLFVLRNRKLEMLVVKTRGDHGAGEKVWTLEESMIFAEAEEMLPKTDFPTYSS